MLQAFARDDKMLLQSRRMLRFIDAQFNLVVAASFFMKLPNVVGNVYSGIDRPTVFNCGPHADHIRQFKVCTGCQANDAVIFQYPSDFVGYFGLLFAQHVDRNVIRAFVDMVGGINRIKRKTSFKSSIHVGQRLEMIGICPSGAEPASFLNAVHSIVNDLKRIILPEEAAAVAKKSRSLFGLGKGLLRKAG